MEGGKRLSVSLHNSSSTFSVHPFDTEQAIFPPKPQATARLPGSLGWLGALTMNHSEDFNPCLSPQQAMALQFQGTHTRQFGTHSGVVAQPGQELDEKHESIAILRPCNQSPKHPHERPL